MFLLSSNFFLKICQEHHHSVHWVQIVNKGYQQTTKVTANKERVFLFTVKLDISQGNRKNCSSKMGLYLGDINYNMSGSVQLNL